MAEPTGIQPSVAGGKSGVEQLKNAEKNPDSVAVKEPVALYGLIAFGISAILLVVGVIFVDGLQFAVLVVMLAQLYYTREKVFSPISALKLLRA